MIFLLFTLWRLYSLLASFASSSFLPFSPGYPYADIFLLPSRLPRFIFAFAGFDGVHYLTIAQRGYAAQFTQVFFPLYPLILSLFSRILFFINPVLSGLLITNILFLAAIIVFYRLLLLDFTVRRAHWAVIFMLVFPVSFFFGSL